MSLINEYRATKQAIEELQQRLQSMSGKEELQRDIEFEQKLQELMEQYEKKARDVILILDPTIGARGVAGQPKKSRAPRELKVYVNPHTNATIETKGGNHKTLKEWKEQYGADVVEGWKKA